MNESTVAVVGAGIGGLALAALLERSAVDVVGYEQSAGATEPGAGIQVAPNGARVLHRLGLGPALAEAAVRPAAIELRGWRRGERLARTELGPACVARYGAPYYTLRRHDLHAMLRSIVSSPIHTGRTLVGLRDHGLGVGLDFSDGTRASASIVVGADGIRSAVRRALHGGAAVASGLTVVRGLVPADRLAPRGPEPTIEVWLGPGQHVVCYPIPGWINFVAAVGGGARGPVSVDELHDAYPAWHPRVRELFDAATSLTRWPVDESPSLSRWGQGRVTLVGDAAHAMLPVGAQGASLALEDVAALAACVRDAAEPSALRTYEAVRLPRVSRLVDTAHARADEHHLADGADQRSRDARLASAHTLEAQSWLYGYDAAAVVAA